jgi:hypothetical protein
MGREGNGVAELTDTLVEHPKASKSIYYDYFFLDQGIVFVRLMSPAVYVGIGVSWVLVLQVLSLALGTAAPFIPTITFAGLLVLLLLSWIITKHKRATLGRTRVAKYLMGKGESLVPWSEVSNVKLVAGELSFTVQDESTKVKLKKNDITRVQQLISSKTRWLHPP